VLEGEEENRTGHVARGAFGYLLKQEEVTQAALLRRILQGLTELIDDQEHWAGGCRLFKAPEEPSGGIRGTRVADHGFEPIDLPTGSRVERAHPLESP
jgi:hypothetical protein